MARKTRRRPFRRPNPQQRKEDLAAEQRRLENAAQALLASRSPEQLRRELEEREMLLAEADQAAQFNPNPINLARYRNAASEHQAARVAVQLADRAAQGAS